MSAEGPVTALVLAAGLGTRLPGSSPKGLRLLAGEPLFIHSLLAFDRCDRIERLILAVPVAHVATAQQGSRGRLTKPLEVIAGGERRQDSVLFGLQTALNHDPPRSIRGRLVAVHDAARPFPDAELISRTVEMARDKGSAIPVVPVTDTVRQIDPTGTGGRLVDRETLRFAQTPQVARLDWLLEGYRRGAAEGSALTDEGAALELAGRPVVLVPGSPSNFKITTPADLAAAEGILQPQLLLGTCIGYGEDRHPLEEGRPFILAGWVIDERNGPSGHSDADPLSHALVDAILGACGEGTIGEHFPDTDVRWAGAAGLDLLGRAARVASEKGFAVVNVDAVLILDSPRLSPHAAEIRRRIAGALGISSERVSVKGKRSEGLGFEGTGRGVSCRAVALLVRKASA